MTNIKITALEVENVKRVKAVALDCTGSSLTVIGGRNGQGKTSVLDAIMWTLGGDKYKPSNPIKEGEEKIATRITLDNGIIVERKGINGALKVTSPNGRGGQSLLNEFVSQFALDLPKFMQASGIEKARMLLESYPDLGVKVQKLNESIKAMYADRLAIGRIADQKAKYAAELPFVADAPEQPLSGAEMAEQLKKALTINAKNDEIRNNVAKTESDIKNQEYRAQSAKKRLDELKRQYDETLTEYTTLLSIIESSKLALADAQKRSLMLKDEDTTFIQIQLEEIDSVNAKVRANESKRNAEAEAQHLKEQYNEISQKIEAARAERIKLLSAVTMPLDYLSIDEEGELIYLDRRWDCMSGAEQLRVAAAIASSINKKCGFVLLDRLETMDVDTLREFGSWLAGKNLQAIGTRVGTGPENSIIIEDGIVLEKESETLKL